MILSPSRLLNLVHRAVNGRIRDLGLDVAGTVKAQAPASYVSGNPPVQGPFETATTFGPKTNKVVQPIGNRNAGLAANDPIKVSTDANGNRVVDGKYVDVGSGVTDAEYLLGLRPVAPGNTLLLTASTERSTNSTSYVSVKRFFVTRPGTYRIKGQLSRTGGTTKARVVIELPDGTLLVASSEATYAGTVYPTYGSQFSLDMNQPVPWGSFLIVQLLNDSGPGQTGYISTVTVNYADASATLPVYDAVITN